jgi:hypothetical protein
MSIRAVSLICAGLATTHTLAQTSPFHIFGYGVHTNTGEAIYHYRAVNSSGATSKPVRTGQIEIGRADLKNEPELTTLPIYDGPRYGDRVARIGAPAGWKGYVSGEEEHPRNTVVWDAEDATPLLSPGQTLTGLNVTLPRADPTYLSSRFFIITDDSLSVSGIIEREDSTAPALSITASPNALWPPNNKSVPITVSVAVKDDYDPYPEIRLESITSNEALGPEDISGDATGTDDRFFSLKATRSGTNPAGRIYTITYSATDGSGNRATASTTVTVPHDQRK